MPLTAGTRLGRFEILARLGQGGMGEVYLAADQHLLRRVAIKVLPESFASDPERRRRFEREARAIAALSHPSICALHDFGTDGDVDFLVMEHIEGETLDVRLSRGRVSQAEALRIATAIASGLASAHLHGIVHRDIKPGNIMLTSTGPKLLDFGLAQLRPPATLASEMPAGTAENVLTVAGAIIGTPSYMAPEQIESGTVDARTDVFAFGAVLYEMLLGRKAFGDSTSMSSLAAVLHSDPFAIPTPLSGHLRHILEACLAKNPETYRVAIVPTADLVVAAGQAPQISPSGARVAFVASDVSGTSHLYVQALDALAPRLLPGTVGATQPFWAPDSRRLGFFAEGKLKTTAIDGRAPRTLADAPVPRGGTWNEDDVILFVPAPPSDILMIQAEGGSPRAVPASRDGLTTWFPSFLPDGRHFLYLEVVLSDRRATMLSIGALDSSFNRALVASSSSGQYAAEHLLIWQDSTLRALPFDPKRLEVTGVPQDVADSVASNAVTYQTLASTSSTGVLTYLDARPRSHIVWMDRSGNVVDEVAPAGNYGNVCLASDSKQALYDRADETGNLDIWAVEPAAAPSRLTFDPSEDFYLTCSPDAAYTAFASLRGGYPTIYTIDVAVPGSEKLLLDAGIPTLANHVATQHGAIVYSALQEATGWDLWILPLAGERDPYAFAESPADEVNGRLSPDGRWLAYASNDGGAYEVYVRPFPDGPGRWQVSKSGGFQPRWRSDGRELFFLAPDGRLMAAMVNGSGSTFSTSDVIELFTVGVTAWEGLSNGAQYAPTSDGLEFLVNRRRPEAAALPITAVINWPGALVP
jgi:Tol biopolymer transport system component